MIKRKDVLNILFWILLIILAILVLWKIFGDSPSELAITLTAILTLLLKLWSISDELKEFKSEVKLSFQKARQDINNLQTKKIK